jgi:hypothetical protein
MNNKLLETLYIQISTDQYHFLKFILEGYDGLGMLSSSENGVVVLRYPREMKKDLMHLLASIGRKIRRKIYREYELSA